jgi:hypothetical protein
VFQFAKIVPISKLFWFKNYSKFKICSNLKLFKFENYFDLKNVKIWKRLNLNNFKSEQNSKSEEKTRKNLPKTRKSTKTKKKNINKSRKTKNEKLSILLIKQNPTKGSLKLSILTCRLATSSTNHKRLIFISIRPFVLQSAYTHALVVTRWHICSPLNPPINQNGAG